MKKKYYLADTKTIRTIKQFDLDILYNYVYKELQKKIKETYQDYNLRITHSKLTGTEIVEYELSNGIIAEYSISNLLDYWDLTNIFLQIKDDKAIFIYPFPKMKECQNQKEFDQKIMEIYQKEIKEYIAQLFKKLTNQLKRYYFKILDWDELESYIDKFIDNQNCLFFCDQLLMYEFGSELTYKTKYYKKQEKVFINNWDCNFELNLKTDELKLKNCELKYFLDKINTPKFENALKKLNEYGKQHNIKFGYNDCGIAEGGVLYIKIDNEYTLPIDLNTTVSIDATELEVNKWIDNVIEKVDKKINKYQREITEKNI